MRKVDVTYDFLCYNVTMEVNDEMVREVYRVNGTNDGNGKIRRWCLTSCPPINLDRGYFFYQHGWQYNLVRNGEESEKLFWD